MDVAWRFWAGVLGGILIAARARSVTLVTTLRASFISSTVRWRGGAGFVAKLRLIKSFAIAPPPRPKPWPGVGVNGGDDALEVRRLEE